MDFGLCGGDEEEEEEAKAEDDDEKDGSAPPNANAPGLGDRCNLPAVSRSAADEEDEEEDEDERMATRSYDADGFISGVSGRSR